MTNLTSVIGIDNSVYSRNINFSDMKICIYSEELARFACAY